MRCGSRQLLEEWALAGASLTAHCRRQGWSEAALTALASICLCVFGDPVARTAYSLALALGGASEQPVYFSSVIPRGKGHWY